MDYQAVFSAPFAKIGIRCSDEVLLGLEFLPLNKPVSVPGNALAREVCRQLERYLAKADFRFDLPLELHATTHQRKVWMAMRTIPCGETCSYSELAAAVQSCPRAVGQACGKNPVPIVIPCHRVVGKAGLGGFMHRADNGALDIKRWLLAHERR